MQPATGSNEERLREVLAFVDGHVKFAETKNAALLAANGVTLIAVLQILTGEHPVGDWLERYLWILAGGNTVSAVVALLSFLPVTQIPWLRRPRRREATGNLLFFGDVHRFNGTTYLQALSTALEQDGYASNEFERMYADQVVANSKIASRKFTYFKVAIWSTLAGLLTPIPAAVLLAFVANRDL
jgi:hypothetical protein